MWISVKRIFQALRRDGKMEVEVEQVERFGEKIRCSVLNTLSLKCLLDMHVEMWPQEWMGNPHFRGDVQAREIIWDSLTD